MKKVLMVIVVCFVLCGCFTTGLGYKELRSKVFVSHSDAESVCYQLGGVLEAKSKKGMSIAKAKMISNPNPQFQQCINQLNTLKQKLEFDKCLSKTEKYDTGVVFYLSCLKKADKAFTSFVKEFTPKTKNITFTCSQGDDVLAKFGPKFDADIATYALDTIQFKPLVSKELSQDVAKNIAQELDKNLFKDIDKKATAEFIKEKSDSLNKEVFCAYKMRYYGGDLRELAMFQQSGIFADDILKAYDEFQNNIIKEKNELANAAVFISESSNDYRISGFTTNYESVKVTKAGKSIGTINKEIAKINEYIKEQQNTYKNYSKQKRKEYHQTITKEIAYLVIEKRKLEAMLKFIKEQ